MTEYTDQEILKCLKDRQSYVVHYLFDRYLPMIRLMVYRKGGTAEDAKDIFQDALVILLTKIDNNELVLKSKFKTYLYCICEILWKKVLDKRQVAANYFERRSEDLLVQDFTEIYDNTLYEHMFYDMFDTLEPLCKQMLKLYWQDMSPKEIAEKLGYAYSYVRKKKCECQGELVQRVKNHPDYKAIIETQANAENVIYD